jgi:hypothetical protein
MAIENARTRRVRGVRALVVRRGRLGGSPIRDLAFLPIGGLHFELGRRSWRADVKLEVSRQDREGPLKEEVLEIEDAEIQDDFSGVVVEALQLTD